MGIPWRVHSARPWGSGDYFDVADTVLMLDEYRYANVIERGLWVLPLLMGY